MALGQLTGRYAFALDTGMGKTESVVAFLSALHQLNIRDVSVLVCQSKVESLCELKRKLLAEGIPEEDIGLIHSYRHDLSKLDINGKPISDNYASLPATPKSEQRLFQLVTHNKVMHKASFSDRPTVEAYNTYMDKPRSLAIWDESLIASETVSLTEEALYLAVMTFEKVCAKYPSHTASIAWFNDCLSLILQELKLQKDGHAPSNLTLPFIDEETSKLQTDIVKQFNDETHKPTLLSLLDLAKSDIRVLLTQQDEGIISYNLSVPPELKDIVILDASYHIRELEKMDSSITSIAKFIKPKRYDNVSVFQMPVFGGRNSMTKDFKESSMSKRKITKELANVIKSIPPSEAVLIFTYKAKGVDFTKIILNDLKQHGVDTGATVSVQDGGITIQKPRIVVTTWGNETSSNDYVYCQNMILAGILHRSDVDIASAMAGQSDNLMLDIKTANVKQVLNSEVAHLAYQAISRGSCRKVNNGYALPMKAWIIHNSLELRPMFDIVMPNAKWSLWEEVDPNNKGVINRIAMQILAMLGGLKGDNIKVSTSRLKKDLKLTMTPSQTWLLAVKVALTMTKKWKLEGRSIVSITEFEQCFGLT
jgi:hypothetical protein